MAKKSYTYCNKIVHLLQQNHTLIAKIVHLWQKSSKILAYSAKMLYPCTQIRIMSLLCHYYEISM